MAETPTIKLPSNKDVEDYFKSQGVGSTNQPSRRQMMGIPPEEASAPRPEPKDEWERLGRLSEDDPDAFEKKIERIPMGHDFLLTVGADDLDRFNTLGQLYGEENVRGLKGGDFLVRKLDKKTGKEEYLRTDEKGLTWRDASDFVGGVVSATPEIAGWVAATSYHASKAPQHPYTKAGLLALTASGMAGSELAGGAKDYLYRKHGIKQDPRTGEIIGRRAVNFAIGVPLGYGIGRLTGGGKFSKKEINQFQKMYDTDPALFAKKYWDHPDDIIASVAKETAEKMGIELPGAAMTLTPATVKATMHAQKMASRVPGTQDVMRPYDLSQQRGLATAKRELTKGPVDYEAVGSGVRGAATRGEEQLRHWSQAEATKAVTKAEETALSQLPPMAEVGAFDAKAAGDKLRTAVQGHAERRKNEVTALYEGVEDQLAKEGVVDFVEFKKLADAIRAWRKELPPITEEVTIPSPIIGGTPTVQMVKTPLGQYDEATKKANEWVQIAENPITLKQAQKLIIDLGEMSRAGTAGTEEGVTGLKGTALNKFYSAAKADLDDAFKSLKISDDLKGQWGEANLQHAMKVDELNKSSFIQSALRTGRAGGKEVESAELLTHLIGGTSPATRKAELKLLQGMLEPAEYEELRQGLLKQMVGLNFPTKITNTTGLPYIQPTSGRVVPAEKEIEIVDLGPLMAHFDTPGNLGFLKEIFGGERQVKTLKAALNDFKEMQELHGKVGRSAGIEAAIIDDLLIELKRGDSSGARAIMRNAIGAEKERRKIYLDLLDDAYRKNNFEMIATNPEQFVDDVILAGGNKSAEFGKTFFKELPDDVKDQVRRATADRIIARTSDILTTPTKFLRKGSGKTDSLEPKEGAFLKMMFDDPARQKLFKQMFSPREMDILNDYAAIMQVAHRMKSIGGGAGSFAVETAIGGGSLKSLGTQFVGAKAVMSGPGQELMSKGGMKSGTGAFAWLVRILNRDKEKAARTASESAAMAAMNLKSGISPKKIKLGMLLAPPTAAEVQDLANDIFALGMDYAGGDQRKRSEWESTFGIPIDGLPSSKEIEDFMGQELKKKQEE